MTSLVHASPIGVFDSGVGGLSVWREIRRLLPQENTRYVADQANIPYGPRSVAEIRGFSQGITEFLIGQGCKVIVIACNTASGAALHSLRNHFPHIPFVGMEPAVKPAAKRTKTGAIGVIATLTTFQGDLFRNLVHRFGADTQIYTQTCPGLVEIVESGKSTGPLAEKIVRSCIEPLLSHEIDQLVLGCTHYPFLYPLIKRIIGPEITLVDPSPAIARQVKRVLCANDTINTQSKSGQHIFYTTSSPDSLSAFVESSIGPPLPNILQTEWQSGQLTEAGDFA